MALKASNTTIGAFVVAALALGVAAITLLGSGSWFQDTFILAFVFEGDVSGLSVGAPVTIKGFKIGSVRKLRLDYDLDSGEFRTTALADMEPNITPMDAGQSVTRLVDADEVAAERERILRDLVEDGARAQLSLQSFVTGLLKIDIDFPAEAEPARLERTAEGYWKIPTQSSSLEILQRTLSALPLREAVQEAIDTLRSVRALSESEDLRRALAGLDERLLSLDSEVRAVSSEIRSLVKDSSVAVAELKAESSATLTEIRDLANNVSAQVEPTAANLNALAESAKASFDEAQKLLGSLSGLTPSDSALAHQLSGALDSLAGAMDSLRVLASYLEQHPEALLRGKD